MNQALAQEALRALTASGFETHNGYCSRWCRQVTAALYGPDKYRSLWGASAKVSAQNFLAANLGKRMNAAYKPQIGDILFKTVGSGGFGHVGIVTERGVAENSTTHWNATNGRDARGLRSLAQFGAYQVVGQLPAPVLLVQPPVSIEPLLILDGKPLDVIMVNGRAYTATRDTVEAVGRTVAAINDQMEENKRFYMNTSG